MVCGMGGPGLGGGGRLEPPEPACPSGRRAALRFRALLQDLLPGGTSPSPRRSLLPPPPPLLQSVRAEKRRQFASPCGLNQLADLQREAQRVRALQRLREVQRGAGREQQQAGPDYDAERAERVSPAPKMLGRGAALSCSGLDVSTTPPPPPPSPCHLNPCPDPAAHRSTPSSSVPRRATAPSSSATASLWRM